MEIDLFAHPGNNKLKLFASQFCHPTTPLTDALQIDWNRWNQLYLFPPPAILQEVLVKLRLFKGHGAIVVPDFPSATWLPELLQFATELPIKLDLTQETLSGTQRLECHAPFVFRVFNF